MAFFCANLEGLVTKILKISGTKNSQIFLGFEFYEVKKNVIIFQEENGNTFTLFIIFIVKSLQKEQNSTNLLL